MWTLPQCVRFGGEDVKWRAYRSASLILSPHLHSQEPAHRGCHSQRMCAPSAAGPRAARLFLWLLSCPACTLLSKLAWEVQVSSRRLGWDSAAPPPPIPPRPRCNTQHKFCSVPILTLRVARRWAGWVHLLVPDPQAAPEIRAQWTEPLAQSAAVIWQRAPSPGEGQNCAEAMGMPASQVCAPEREKQVCVAALGSKRADENGGGF